MLGPYKWCYFHPISWNIKIKSKDFFAVCNWFPSIRSFNYIIHLVVNYFVGTYIFYVEAMIFFFSTCDDYLKRTLEVHLQKFTNILVVRSSKNITCVFTTKMGVGVTLLMETLHQKIIIYTFPNLMDKINELTEVTQMKSFSITIPRLSTFILFLLVRIVCKPFIFW